jgi:hypothetical protein
LRVLRIVTQQRLDVFREEIRRSRTEREHESPEFGDRFECYHLIDDILHPAIRI